MADLFSIGRSGLAVSKKALETTSHNISNANTEGFSRQKVEQQTNTPHLKDGLISGTGAKINHIRRVHDEHIEKRLNTNIAEKEYHHQRETQLGHVQEIFNEIDNEGLNNVLNKFFNSFRDLANHPENDTVRSVIRDNANLVVKDFNRIRNTLDSLAKNIDLKLEMTVQELNDDIQNIANLNKRIQILEVGGGETGDLRDQRDVVIRKMSKNFKLSTYLDNKSNFNVHMDGVGTLVTGPNAIPLTTGRVSKDKAINNMEGSLIIFFKNRPTSPMTHKFKLGNIQGLVSARNVEIQRLQKNIDKIAYEFAKTVNSIHQKGYVNRQIEVDASGKPVAGSDSNGRTTGIDFFELPKEIDGAARNLRLSESIQGNLSNVVTALAPNKPGDNRVAIAISKLQHQKLLDDGNATLEENYLKSVADIGLAAGKAGIDGEQAEGIFIQMQAVKDRMSGVSIDEEAANLVRYQRVYDASAKAMRVAGELFDTVLGIVPY